MLRRYIVTGILTTNKALDGTTTEEAKDLLDTVVETGIDEAFIQEAVESFEVKVIKEDTSFVG